MQKIKEVRSLTGLRGVAAVSVVMGHVLAPCFPAFRWLAFENAAVDVFFCLSGFTLCLTYGLADRPKMDWRKYAVARFARIYPLYIVVLLAAWWYSQHWNINEFSSYTPHGLARDAVRQIAMVNAWPVIGSGAHWAAPMWSLSIEFFCYLTLFPLAVFSTRFVIAWRSQAVLAAMVVFSFTSYVVALKFYNAMINEHHVANVALPWQAHWVNIIRGITMFAAGWFAYILWAQRTEVTTSIMSTASCIGLIMVMVLLGSDLSTMDRHLLVWLSPLLVLSLMNEKALVSRILAAGPIHFLGLISYSIYLIHWPLFFAGMIIMRDGSNGSKAVAGALLTVFIAPFSYFFIERPARDALKRWLNRRPVTGGSGTPGYMLPVHLESHARG